MFMKFKMLNTINVFIILLTFISVTASYAATLLKEDFEGGKLDEAKWFPKKEWKIIEPQSTIKALGNGVVDINGGEANFSKRQDFTDFVFEADFVAKTSGKITGFVFRGTNINNNFYMHQISCDGSGQITYVGILRKVVGKSFRNLFSVGKN